MTSTPNGDPEGSDGGTVDCSHLLLVGAGPGLGRAVARRFAVGGYRVTLVARSTDGLRGLAGALSDTGAEIATIKADASDPEGLYSQFADMPAISVHGADDEVFLDDSRRYVEHALIAGIDASLDVWMGMPHGFVASVGKLKEVARALDATGVFLRRASSST